MCITKHWREIFDPAAQIFLNSNVPQPLTFGIQSPQVGFPCSIKCSKSKNYKVPQTFRDYGTKKSELLNYIFKASSNLPSKI